MGPDIAALVAATLFGTAAIVGAGGAVFLGARALHLFSRAQAELRDSVEDLKIEIGEVQERLDSHERTIQQQREVPLIERTERA